MMTVGGAQLKKVVEDDGIYWWKYHVDWRDPSQSKLVGPVKIPVAPYHYLGDGQLTRCVPQPGTTMKLDVQGEFYVWRRVALFANFRNLTDATEDIAIYGDGMLAAATGARAFAASISDPPGARDRAVADALRGIRVRNVYGYALGLDMTRRDLQGEAKKMGRPWDTAKGFDHSAPLGPMLTFAIPQSDPAGDRKSSASRRSLVNTADVSPCSTEFWIAIASSSVW